MVHIHKVIPSCFGARLGFGISPGLSDEPPPPGAALVQHNTPHRSSPSGGSQMAWWRANGTSTDCSSGLHVTQQCKDGRPSKNFTGSSKPLNIKSSRADFEYEQKHASCKAAGSLDNNDTSNGHGSGSSPTKPTNLYHGLPWDSTVGNIDQTRSEHLPKNVPPCHLHQKMCPKCKRCQRFRHATMVHEQRQNQPIENSSLEVQTSSCEQLINFSPILRTQIEKSLYFKSLLAMTDPLQVLEDIYHHAHHAEVYTKKEDTEPSTLFCCLYRLISMKLPEAELRSLLVRTDSPYLRAVGFLYIRFSNPKDAWPCFRDYLFDMQEFFPGVCKLKSQTLGRWIEGLLAYDKYYGTQLPRIPHTLKQHLVVWLAQIEDLRANYEANCKHFPIFQKGDLQVQVLTTGCWTDAYVLSSSYGASPFCLRCRVRHSNGLSEDVSLGLVRIKRKRARELSADATMHWQRRSPSCGRREVQPTTDNSGGSDDEQSANLDSEDPEEQCQEYLCREREKATVELGEVPFRHVLNHKCMLVRRCQGLAAKVCIPKLNQGNL